MYIYNMYIFIYICVCAREHARVCVYVNSYLSIYLSISVFSSLSRYIYISILHSYIS